MLNLLDRPELILGLVAVVCLALGALIWVIGRARSVARDNLYRPVVSRAEANAPMYPYVYVSDAGGVRELLSTEKQFLETSYPPDDPLRPYVKSSYDEWNEAGTLGGYCRRASVPRGMRIAYPPIERPLQTQAQH